MRKKQDKVLDFSLSVFEGSHLQIYVHYPQIFTFRIMNAHSYILRFNIVFFLSVLHDNIWENRCPPSISASSLLNDFVLGYPVYRGPLSVGKRCALCISYYSSKLSARIIIRNLSTCPFLLLFLISCMNLHRQLWVSHNYKARANQSEPSAHFRSKRYLSLG